MTAEIGDRVKVRVTVTNAGRLPVPWVLLEDLLPGDALDAQYPRLKVKGKRLRIAMLSAGGEMELAYTVECLRRGYFQIGPLVMENGDSVRAASPFPRGRRAGLPAGLSAHHAAGRLRPDFTPADRRRADDAPPLRGSDAHFRRPPLRNGRSTQSRPLASHRANRRQLHSKVHEPSTLSGATVLLDFHQSGYHDQGEPFRSELAVTIALALANAVYEMGQQIGLVTNGRDAADRIRPKDGKATTRAPARRRRSTAAMTDESHRLRPLIVETRRGAEQLHHIRDTLARVELADGLTFAGLIAETTSRLPRDATLVAVLADVPEETAITLGSLHRAGRAITVVLIQLDENNLQTCYGRLIAEGVRDIRHLKDEAEVPALCRKQVDRSAPYSVV